MTTVPRRPRAWYRRARSVLMGVGLSAVPALLAAQSTDRRSVEGRVVLPAPAVEADSLGTVPVPNLWVVLHRVAPNLSGPLDSMRTNAQGGYRFDYQPSGGDQAVYFVSASYGGIAYFSNPLREAETRGDEAQVTVFDTTSVAFPLTVRGRHLIVSEPDSSAHRTIIEVFELSNDSTRTIVAPEDADAEPTWTFSIPEAAVNLEAGQGDLPADAFVQSRGQVALYAALAPGLKQLSVSYRVPASAFPLEISVDHGAVVLEVLLEEPGAHVHGANLIATQPVALEGRQFQRFLSQDVRPGEQISLESPDSAVGRTLYVSVLVGAVALLVLVSVLRAGMRRQRPIADAGRRNVEEPEVPTPDRLAREIADLDAAFARQRAPSDAVRKAYEHRRAELADALREELADGGQSA